MQILTQKQVAPHLFWFFVASATLRGITITPLVAIHHLNEEQLRLWQRRFDEFSYIRVASRTFAAELSYKWIRQVNKGRRAFYHMVETKERQPTLTKKRKRIQVQEMADTLMTEYTWHGLMDEARVAGVPNSGAFKVLAFRMARHMLDY